MTARQVFDAIAEEIEVLVRDVTFEEALPQMGETFAWFLKAENRASGARAKKELRWQPKRVGILDEISEGSYQAVAKSLRK